MATLTLVHATELVSTTFIAVANNMTELDAFATTSAVAIATGISTSSDASVGTGVTTVSEDVTDFAATVAIFFFYGKQKKSPCRTNVSNFPDSGYTQKRIANDVLVEGDPTITRMRPISRNAIYGRISILTIRSVVILRIETS